MAEGMAQPAGGIRFTVRTLPGMEFIRYPITVLPAEGTVGFVNASDWQSPAMFKDGVWCTLRGKAFKRVPTHWTILDEERRA